MKIQAIGLMALLVCAPVFAKSDLGDSGRPVRHLSAQLHHFTLQDGGILATSQIVGGRVAIDRQKKEIKLELVARDLCPKGAFCAAVSIVGPMTYTYSARLVSVKRDSCGTRIFRAVTDQRPVDGFRTEITVADYTLNRCLFVAMDPTQMTHVTLTLQGGFRHEFLEIDYLTGSALEGTSIRILPVFMAE